MKVQNNKVVTINYVLKNNKGQTIDSTEGQGPLSFIQGTGGMIEGLEKRLDNKKAGEKFSAEIPPEEAYGLRDESKVQSIPLTSFKDPENLEPGIHINLETEQGPQMATVIKLDDSNATIDLNHPLANETLFFDVDVKEVRNPTEEELSHGHVHGPEGHHHH